MLKQLTSPDAAGTETPFVIGLDGNCHSEFLVTNNQDRFPEIPLYKKRHYMPSSNEGVNSIIVRFLGIKGIDAIFAGSAEKVMSYVRQESCAVLLYHPDKRNMSDSSRVLTAKEVGLKMIMYSSLPDGIEIKDYPLVENTEDQIFELEEGLLAFMKPEGVTAMVNYVKAYCDELLQK